MLFYGAGNCGKEALDKYLERVPGGDDIVQDTQEKCNDALHGSEILKGFIDSKKTGNYCGYPIISVSEIQEKDTNIVITIKDRYSAGEVYNRLKRIGINHIYWYNGEDSRKLNGDFLQEECIDCSSWGECVLPKVEMHIADHCNLNCKGCTHFSPIFGKELPDFEARIRDVKLLKEKIPHILIFSILGGEPFLNPDVHLYMTEIRKILPDTYIRIVTNGLLIPQLKQEVFECIRKNEIVVQISEYKPTHKIIDRIEKKLKEYGITYYIQSCEDKQKFIKPLSLTDKSRYPQKCISEGCVNIWNGKIAKCPTLMYIDNFNKKFDKNLPNKGVMQLEDCPKGFELLDMLQKDVPLCRHCVCCEIEWEQCGINPTVTDFASIY